MRQPRFEPGHIDGNDAIYHWSYSKKAARACQQVESASTITGSRKHATRGRPGEGRRLTRKTNVTSMVVGWPQAWCLRCPDERQHRIRQDGHVEYYSLGTWTRCEHNFPNFDHPTLRSPRGRQLPSQIAFSSIAAPGKIIDFYPPRLPECLHVVRSNTDDTHQADDTHDRRAMESLRNTTTNMQATHTQSNCKP